MTRKFRLNRRSFLRGSVGGVLTSLALPPLEAMMDANGESFAQGGAFPTHLGLWFWGNGVRPDKWTPSSFGRDWAPSEELQPLVSAGLKPKLNVLTNYHANREGTAHHKGQSGILTGTYDPRRGTYGNPTGPSLTYLAAKRWMADEATKTLYGSMDVGISNRGKNRSQPNHGCVVNDEGNFIPIERSPRAIFDRWFDNFMPSANPDRAEAVRKVRASALDALNEDADALKKKLGQADRARLDEHLEGYRALERNLDAYEEAVCALNITRPGGKDDYGNTDQEDLRAKNRIMSDMIVLALSCGLTRTFSVTHHTMQSDVRFHNIGATEGMHVMTHDDRGLDTKLDPQLERLNDVLVYLMGEFSYLLAELDKVPFGDGTLLDRCCVMATSEVEDGTRHKYDSMPLLLAGGAGGKLATGLHVNGNGAKATQVLLTVLRAVGHDLPSFGDEIAYTDKIVEDIWRG